MKPGGKKIAGHSVKEKLMDFYTLLTNIGKTKLVYAQVNNKPILLTYIAVGDSDGNYYEPDESQTSLLNEVWRGNICRIYQDATNPERIVIETAIPVNSGGFYIREAGIFDNENNLIAVAKIPESYKPYQSEGATRDFFIKIVLEIGQNLDTAFIIDPSVVIASRQYIDNDHNNDVTAHFRKIDADMVDGYHAGNAENQLAVSNEALCQKLNADMVDGFHAGNGAGKLLIIGPDGKVPDSNLKPYALDNHNHDVLLLQNSLNLHGFHNMKIHSGLNSGTTTYVYPPEGFVMENLAAFICSLRTIYFSGDVDGNDSLYCYWTTDAAKIILTCYNSEQRATPTVNWLAIWRK